MPSENIEVMVTLGRMEERIKNMQQDMTDAKVDLKNQTLINDQFRSMARETNERVKSVESSLAKSAPTIEEFITIKHKVVGAGLLGKWVWGAAGIILGLLVAGRSFISNWLSGSP